MGLNLGSNDCAESILSVFACRNGLLDPQHDYSAGINPFYFFTRDVNSNRGMGYFIRKNNSLVTYYELCLINFNEVVFLNNLVKDLGTGIDL